MKTKEMKKVAILGTGTIGASWATFFAGKGIPVAMYDVDSTILEKGVQRAKESLATLVEYDLLDKSMLDRATGNVLSAGNLPEMVEGADYIQESIPENYEIKKKINLNSAPVSLPFAAREGVF